MRPTLRRTGTTHLGNNTPNNALAPVTEPAEILPAGSTPNGAALVTPEPAEIAPQAPASAVPAKRKAATPAKKDAGVPEWYARLRAATDATVAAGRGEHFDPAFHLLPHRGKGGSDRLKGTGNCFRYLPAGSKKGTEPVIVARRIEAHITNGHYTLSEVGAAPFASIDLSQSPTAVLAQFRALRDALAASFSSLTNGWRTGSEIADQFTPVPILAALGGGTHSRTGMYTTGRTTGTGRGPGTGNTATVPALSLAAPSGK